MAILGKWTGGTVAILPGTTWAAPASLFPTEDRNDSSTYTFTAATSLLTLPSSGLADGYLLVGAYEFEDTSNGRCNPQARFVQSSGTGTFVSGQTGGYNRDTSEDRSYVRTWAFVDNPSASATFSFQWRRDTDTPTGGTVRSEFQVIPLYYSDFGAYTSTDATPAGSTTQTIVPGFTGTDGTNITISSNVISCTGDNKRYLFLGSQFWDGLGGGTRTQRWHSLAVDSTDEDAAKAYSYYRNAANDQSGDLFTWLIETVTATVTLEMREGLGAGVSALQGGADVVGATTSTAGAHSMVVLELNDSAEVFRSRDNTQSALLATTGPIDLQINTVTDFNDTASFTDLVDSSINCVQTADYLFGANISAASNAVADATRWTAYAEFTINGTENADSVAGDYMRNNQSSQDTFGWSANLLGFEALTAGDDVGVSVTELVGSEGGGAGVSPAGWSGFWGINLDTMEASADATVEPGAGSLTSTGQVPTISVEGTDSHTATPGAGSLNLTGLLSYNYGGPGLRLISFEPSVVIETAGAAAEPDSGNLTITGQVPTLDQTQHITEEPDAGALALTGEVPTATVSDHVVIGVPAGELTLSGEVPEVLVSITVFPDVGSVTLTGEIPTLDQTLHHIRAPPAGTLTLAGLTPTIDRTEHQTVEPDTGTLTLTGLVPVVNTGANVIKQPDPGSLSLTGYAPTLALSDHQDVDPSEGSLVLTGNKPAVALSNHKTIEPDSGSLSLTGFAPSLDYSWTVHPGAGGLTLSGDVPALITGDSKIAQPPSGALVLTGNAPTINRTDHHTIETGLGSLTLTVQAPTVVLTENHSVEPDSGSLTLTGLVPTVSSDGSLVVLPDDGTLSLTGQLPTTVLDISINEICRYYVTENHSIREVRKELFKNDAGTFLFDCNGWGSPTSATWTIQDGEIIINNEQILNGIISADIDLTSYGNAEMILKFTDGSRSKVIKIFITCGDLDKPSDYWEDEI